MSQTPYELNPDHIWLKIPQELDPHTGDKPVLLASTQYQRQVNQICLAVILPYLKEYFADAQVIDAQADLWGLGVNGIGVETEGLRFTFLPSDAWDLDTLQVPQEWVDIPEWVADYYVAVQVDQEEGMVRLWGLTTHKTLKQQGAYSARARTYTLKRDVLAENLNGVWLQQTYFPNTELREEVLPWVAPSLDELLEAWQVLGDTPHPFVHRQIGFATWVGILTHPQWRQQALTLLSPAPESKLVSAVRLSQWFSHRFEAGWLGINQLIAPQLVGAFMDNQIKRAKLIDLGVELAGCQVSLMMTIAKTEQGMSLQASVYPMGEQLFLPSNLKLQILTETGEVFKEVTSRSDDNFILYRFDAVTGDRFTVQVAFGDACVSESFQV